ncbi:MAG TPA: tRNA pseudouridine(38-40) synthase TruA [Vicinamibacterales bacterium]|jgi:tRNA pseudouridine38-40 synthase|nr:tRNA pseudouridine(38-40) synthase TruA [Vicinamibacterales bacterium]
MTTFRITVAYDGTGFAGWQRQANGTSVQGLLEEALADLAGGPVAVTGAGRTDAGVHALAQVASFRLDPPRDPLTIVRAVNARLPPAIRVLAAETAADDFNARFSARAKTYRYRIWNADVINPFERAYTWHVPGGLDVAAMARAAGRLTGRRDFAAFQSAGTPTETTEREVFASTVHGGDGALVTYDITGNGFLRHMVRAIVGSLVEIGRGRRGDGWIGDVLESRDRSQAGPTAPPEGLFLVRVEYGDRLKVYVEGP